MKKTTIYLKLIIGFLFILLICNCSNNIGDSCEINDDCSTSGDWICDTTQPEGYCLELDCSPDNCPSNAACVEFVEGEQFQRICLKGCDSDSQCRTGYFCYEVDNTNTIIIDYESNYKGYCAPK